MPNNNVVGALRPLVTAEAVCAAMAEFSVSSAQLGEIAEARALAKRLIGGAMASTKTIARVHARTGAGLFVVRRPTGLAGLLAFVLLSERGRRALLDGVFDSLSPSPKHIADLGEDVAGVYSWAIAAANHEAAQCVVRGHERVRRVAVPHLPFYLRPVTPQGRRLAVVRLGFKPLPRSRPGLFWAEPSDESLLETAA